MLHLSQVKLLPFFAINVLFGIIVNKTEQTSTKILLKSTFNNLAITLFILTCLIHFFSLSYFASSLIKVYIYMC